MGGDFAALVAGAICWASVFGISREGPIRRSVNESLDRMRRRPSWYAGGHALRYFTVQELRRATVAMLVLGGLAFTIVGVLGLSGALKAPPA